jgi:predicted ABC-type ATPase
VFHLVYVWLESPELCIERVAERVLGGGHHVPGEIVRRRYAAGLRNFFELYRPLAYSWGVYDNSYREAQLVAVGRHNKTRTVYDQRAWSAIKKSV